MGRLAPFPRSSKLNPQGTFLLSRRPPAPLLRPSLTFSPMDKASPLQPPLITVSLYFNHQLHRASSGDLQGSPAREAECLTAYLHLFLNSYKSSAPSSPHLCSRLPPVAPPFLPTPISSHIQWILQTSSTLHPLSS